MQKQWRWIVLMLLMAGLGQMAWGLNSATLTIAGSEQQLSGGWDQNSVTVAFNGFQETVQYGEYSTAASVASALAGKFSNDYLDDGLCAHASGAQITFQLQGTATFGSLLVGGATTSFQVTSPTGFLSIATKADSGTVTLTVNGVTAATTNYGEGSTPETIADGLTDGLQKGSPVSITADGAAIDLTSTATGANTNYSYSLTTTYDSTDFSQPSFSASPASGDLQGGAAANTNGTTVYSYCMPSPNNPNPSCQTSTIKGYDGDGNVTAVVDSVMGTWGYGYDTLNRLALSADNDPNIPYAYYCWSYDQWGNRTQQVGSTTAFPADAGGPYICNSSQPSFSYNTNNQITASPMGAPTYDAAGDITKGTSGNLYLYDAEGRICAVEKGGLMTGYVYDAAGNRVAKGPITAMSCDPTKNGFESSGQESDYILNQSGQPVTKTTMDSSGAMQWVYTNVYADGQLFATYDSSIEGNAGLYFLLNDWLGTRRVTTDYTGLLVQTCSSLPYGDETTCTTAPNVPNEQHFTGKIHDSESGLDYFGARYYSENDARFMTPDWSSKVEPVPYAVMSDPQSLNLYSYMRDNPLGGVDADGHCSAWLCSIFAWGTSKNDRSKKATNASNAAQQKNTEIAQEEPPESLEQIEQERQEADGEQALQPLKPGEQVPQRFDWLHPGPLPESVAKTFAGGRYERVVVGEGGFESDRMLFRVFGGTSGEEGRDGTFYSPEPQKGGIQSIIDLALRPEWGNTAGNVVSVYLPEGTVMYVGTAASQGGFWVGGTPQIYVPK